MANFIYIRQKGPYGNGTPVLNAKEVIGDEPFAVLWGDEFIYAKPPRLKQMMEVYEKYQDCVISGVRIPDKQAVAKYGIADYKEIDKGIFEIKEIVEKPDPDKAPSNLAVHGAYIFNPEIFHYLENIEPGKDNELWLTDAINKLMEDRAVYAAEIKDGKYYDTGNILEYLKANIDFALERDDLKDGLMEYMKSFK
jgi:UTP--glucose-1-phosphate uridylyltransferase